MIALVQIDWKSAFVPSLHLGEIILRGSITYLFLFLVLRFVRRGAGAIGISDLLVVVLIADAAQNAMGSQYKSITEGVVLVGTIVLWDVLLDWLGYRFPVLRRFLRPNALILIKDGRLQKNNLRKQMITEDELLGELREQGVDSIENVKASYMEGDGHISVISRSNAAKS